MTYNVGSILQVSSHEMLGGAERVARDLYLQLRADGYDSWMAVGYKDSEDPHVLPLPHAEARTPWAKAWWGVHDRWLDLPMAAPAQKAGAWAIRRVAEPLTAPAIALGLEDFNHPGTKKLLEMTPTRPSLVHCHNLHTSYFDLRELPSISHQVPTVVTLHDMWLMTGHCGFSMGCERYLIGCGHCPQLNLPPPILRDSTAANWIRKQAILQRSRLYIATPCQWLMDILDRSILKVAVERRKVIPYGIDVSVFRPGDRRAARAALGLPNDALIILTAANGVKTNVYKDYETLRAAAIELGKQEWSRPLILIGIGGEGEPEQIGNITIQMLPFVDNKSDVAKYYHAADIYLHSARAETFPNVVIEALACGTPVVATRAGGIPEQVHSLPWNTSERATTAFRPDSATGVVVPSRDPKALAEAARLLLTNDAVRQQLSENAARDSGLRYDLKRQANEYVDFYLEAQEDFASRTCADKSESENRAPRFKRARTMPSRV